MSKPTPYPADTRAKGWRFEIDYEKVEQSDTWSLAPGELRPWLLMLWVTAWKQTPCGSLPADDELIAARIGMPAKMFQKHRVLLRRGWWLADDGRLYHDTIMSFVVDMMSRRRSDADRKARGRAKNSGGVFENPAGVPRDTTGIANGFPPESDTGTGTGTSSSLRSEGISSGSTPEYSAEFETAWTTYPKRPGASKADTLKAWNARIKAGADVADLLAGVQRYAAFCRAAATEPQFIKQPATFFGPGDHFRTDWAFTPSAPRAPGTPHRHAAAAAAIFDMDSREVIDA